MKRPEGMDFNEYRKLTTKIRKITKQYLKGWMFWNGKQGTYRKKGEEK